MADKKQSPLMSWLLSWQVLLAEILLIASVVVYYIHYRIFHDAEHIFIYMVGDIAFIPIEVLFVTLILHRILEMRDRRNKLKKLNMVIGAFFSETGNLLLGLFADCDPDRTAVRKKLQVNSSWDSRGFRSLLAEMASYPYKVRVSKQGLKKIKDHLQRSRAFLLSLLENPNLLEHDSFTELLWAVFHLTEELIHRRSLAAIKGKDLEHLRIDIQRAYSRVVKEWLQYMDHLRKDYPYLFSLAVRTNPFDPSARAEVR